LVVLLSDGFHKFFDLAERVLNGDLEEVDSFQILLKVDCFEGGFGFLLPLSESICWCVDGWIHCSFEEIRNALNDGFGILKLAAFCIGYLGDVSRVLTAVDALVAGVFISRFLPPVDNAMIVDVLLAAVNLPHSRTQLLANQTDLIFHINVFDFIGSGEIHDWIERWIGF
jgi:hypothetical protein